MLINYTYCSVLSIKSWFQLFLYLELIHNNILVSPGLRETGEEGGSSSERRDDSELSASRSRHPTVDQDYLDTSEPSSSEEYKLHRRSDEFTGISGVRSGGSDTTPPTNRSFDEYRGEAINIPAQLHGGEAGLNLRREVQTERLPASLGSRGISIPTQQHITSMQNIYQVGYPSFIH